MPRAYRLGKREAAVNATRARVIASARELIIEAGFQRASLHDVARRADVSRTAVYYQFGSKLGLLDAVLTDALHRAGLADVIAAVQKPDARDALLASMEASARLWFADHELFRRILGLAMADPELQGAVARREAERLGTLRTMATRLAEQDYLRPGYTPERALDVLNLLSSFATYDTLYSGSGGAVEEIVMTLNDLTGAVLKPRGAD